jgi:hypothetical protein
MKLRDLAIVTVLVALCACASILGIRSQARPFEHGAHVNHGIACVRCHTQVASSNATSPLDLPTAQTCASCHAEAHRDEGYRECSSCHGDAHIRRAVVQAKAHLRFSHATHQGPSQGKCITCHGAVLGGDGALRPTMATCLSCHEHQAQWAERSCTPCHQNLDDERARPASHVVHGPDFMARHGIAAGSSRDLCTSCHRESECAECHGANVPALPQVMHFDEPGRPDMHARGFAARHALEAGVDPATCLSCHRDQSFCRDCHEKRGLLQASATRASPHPAGWVSANAGQNRHGEEARRNPVSCASCHGGAGELLCVGCHRVGGPGGSPHPAGFSSSKALSELPCRLCHSGEL